MIRNLLLLLLTTTFACAQEPQPSREVLDAFEQFVRPIFATHCVACHGPKKQESGLRFDSRKSVFGEHDFGPLLVKGKPDESRLVEVLLYHEDDVQMPPKGKLSDQSITILRKWIELGAPWPDEAEPSQGDADAWKDHWAFQPIARPAPPAIDGNWLATDVDRFIAAKLKAAGRQPSARADARTQIRRLHFDLIGLPPTIEDVRRFEAEPTDEAYRAVVDRLLASKHFGERWARHWMDVARYADTSGYAFREDRKNADAWKYRDWVINSLNDDMSIKDFMIHQIAVDRVLPNTAGDNKLSATGFLTLGRRFLGSVPDIIDDRIDVTTRGLMGFTVTCARCHDHKYDPIPTADYYSLYGVFASTADHERKQTTVRVFDRKKPFEPHIFLRGNKHAKGPKVPRQFLGALQPDRKPFTDGSGRLEFARAIASDNNPLTARVFVNRVWGQVMGRYLVDTPSDFGVRSSPPSHPLLLDHLAASFIDDGWSLKQLLRRIVMSSVYRQSSQPDGDIQNTLYSRMNRKRLEFEPLRDALLTVSGSLDRKIGGESVEITKAPFPKRRTVYAHINRQNLPGVFRAFDLASPDTHAPRRYQTTVPQQGLFQLNHPFVLERSRALAELTVSTQDPAERVRELFRRAYTREPTAEEIADAVAFVTAERTDLSESESGWRYGYGSLDSRGERVARFAPYPAFIDLAWRGTGKNLPDARLGWSLLTAKGGHPGEHGFAAIRRWIAPHDGSVNIQGVLKHSVDKGDGVIGRIISSRTGLLKQAKAANNAALTVVPKVQVKAGETIDFVCDRGNTLFHDTFEWRVQLTLSNGTQRQRFDSLKDFSAASAVGDSPDAWAQLAQVLLMANEFVFVD